MSEDPTDERKERERERAAEIKQVSVHDQSIHRN